MTDMHTIGERAKKASKETQLFTTDLKNKILKDTAANIVAAADDIIKANEVDIKNAIENNMQAGLVDRLRLTKERIQSMADGVIKVAALDDIIGEVTNMKKRPNGLMIGKKIVPLGVVAVIYESRPNVTLDVFALTLKTGNAVILKGGSDAINSNIAIASVIRKTLKENGANEDALILIEDTNRDCVKELMRLNEYVDVIIPRGSRGLINYVVNNSTVPVIETGTGNCHIYVDSSADFDMALDIIYNAKTQRIGVCNACESLVIHRDIANQFIPLLVERLKKKDVVIKGDDISCAISPFIEPASEVDYATEYLDYKISLKTVATIEEAIEHINRYNSGHSESIITKDYANSQRFLDEVDAACVYVNASTRFTDGFEFGFGAEIGISTQKLHARGPMGLEALTSYKYIIYGDGQIRE